MKSREILEILLVVGFICISIPLLLSPFIITVVNINVPSSVNHLNCSDLTLVKTIDNTECDSKPYSGDLCTQLLAKTQSCSIGTLNDVFINISADNQTLLETNLTTLLTILERNGSQRCRDAALPFMCQYTFPLCDNNTKQLYLPTQERCIEISEQVCSQEWNLTRQLGYQSFLPDCMTLRRQFQQNLTCRNGFFNVNGTCQARCEQNNIQGPTTIVANKVLRFAGAISTVAVSGAFLIVSIVRYKEMLSFPLIVLVYMTIEAFILGIALLVTESGFPALLCGSETLAGSMMNPTILCLVSGAIFHYAVVGIYVFWTFHIGYFFYKVIFPFHARAHQSYQKYIHLTMVTFGFLAPLPAVIAALAVEENWYTIGPFFLPICVSKNRNLSMISTTLFTSILLLISTTLLVTIIWKVHKNNRTSEQAPALLSAAEKKLLLILCLSVSAGAVMFVLVVTTRLAIQTQFSLVLEYFECESDGFVPGKCNQAGIQQDSMVWLTSLVFLLLGIIPVINFLFVFNVKKIKEKVKSVKQCFDKLKHSNKEQNGISELNNGPSFQSSTSDLQKSMTDLLS